MPKKILPRVPLLCPVGFPVPCPHFAYLTYLHHRNFILYTLILHIGFIYFAFFVLLFVLVVILVKKFPFKKIYYWYY